MARTTWRGQRGADNVAQTYSARSNGANNIAQTTFRKVEGRRPEVATSCNFMKAEGLAQWGRSVAPPKVIRHRFALKAKGLLQSPGQLGSFDWNRCEPLRLSLPGHYDRRLKAFLTIGATPGNAPGGSMVSIGITANVAIDARGTL